MIYWQYTYLSKKREMLINEGLFTDYVSSLRRRIVTLM